MLDDRTVLDLVRVTNRFSASFVMDLVLFLQYTRTAVEDAAVGLDQPVFAWYWP